MQFLSFCLHASRVEPIASVIVSCAFAKLLTLTHSPQHKKIYRPHHTPVSYETKSLYHTLFVFAICISTRPMKCPNIPEYDVRLLGCTQRCVRLQDFERLGVPSDVAFVT